MSAKGIDNLIQLATRTTEERRELARKAGIASGKARAAKKTIAEMLKVWRLSNSVATKIKFS